MSNLDPAVNMQGQVEACIGSNYEFRTTMSKKSLKKTTSKQTNVNSV